MGVIILKKGRSDMKKTTKSKLAEIKKNKGAFAVYLILRGFVLLSLVGCAVRRDYQGVFYCVLTLILFILPSFLKKSFKISLPSLLESIILVFIFSAQILGELNSYYLRVPHFDTLLHTINGFICAAFGFGLVDLLNRGRQKISLSPLYLAIAAFCFSMTIGVLWEFFEFGMDTFFSTDMQKDTVLSAVTSVKLNPTGENVAVTVQADSVSINGAELGVGGYLDIGLFDTMKDLFVNFIGALIFSIIGFVSLKTKKRSRVVESLVPRTSEDE
jgi:hypothetical protein